MKMYLETNVQHTAIQSGYFFHYLKKNKNIDKIEYYNTNKRQRTQLPFIASVWGADSSLVENK